MLHSLEASRVCVAMDAETLRRITLSDVENRKFSVLRNEDGMAVHRLDATVHAVGIP